MKALTRRPNRPPTLLRGVLVALLLSLAGGAAFAGLAHLMHPAAALRLVIAVLGGCYVFWLISRSDARIGTITSFVGWSAASIALWFSPAPIALYVLVHVALIWLIRSLYFHASVPSALLDLALSGLGVGAALWATEQSNSLFMAVWCFFLVQAFFVVIPRALSERSGHPGRPGQPADETNQTFHRAQRTAEAALRRISANS